MTSAIRTSKKQIFAIKYEKITNNYKFSKSHKIDLTKGLKDPSGTITVGLRLKSVITFLSPA